MCRNATRVQGLPSCALCEEKPVTQQEVNEAFEDRLRRKIFHPVKRHILIEHEVEDRWADAVAQTWAMFSRYATEKGCILPDAVLVHSCKQRACDLNRRFVGTQGARGTNRDVLDPRAFRDGHVRVYRLGGIHDDEQADEADRAIEVSLAESMADDPEQRWNSALDLESWIGQQTFQDQGLMSGKMMGKTTKELAHETHLPYMVAWRKEKALGHELASRAGVEIRTSK